MRFFYSAFWKSASGLILLSLLANAANAQQRSLADVKAIASSFHPNRVEIQRAPRLGSQDLQITPSSKILSGYGLTDQCEAFYICSDASRSEDGFVIVSGDEKMPAVLGYSSHGQFSIDAIPDNMRYLLECYASQKENLANTQCKVSEAQSSVGPLLTCKWDQSTPYNNLCPMDAGGRSVTGCLATAASQVMYYHRYPDCGVGEVNYVTESQHLPVNLNLEDYPFDWNNMLDRYESGRYNNTQAEAVARLMYAVGAASRMDYSSDESGAHQYYLGKALVENFGYDQDLFALDHDNCTDQVWLNTIVRELNAGRPLFMAGQALDGGHGFVLDGYDYDEFNNLFVSINWGWSGYYDGYFIITDLNPSGQGIGGFEGGYNSGQCILINWMPENNTADQTYAFKADDLRLSRSAFDSGEEVSLSFIMEGLYNRRFVDYYSVVAYYLQDEEGNIQYLSEQYGFNAASYSGWNALSVDLNIGVLPDGKYSILAYSWPLYEEGYSPILTKNGFPTFTVGEVAPPVDPAFMPTLTASSLVLDESSCNGFRIAADFENLMNWDALSFYGDISLALYSVDTDDVLVLDGNYFSLPESSSLAQDYYFNKMQHVGPLRVPSNIERGYYDVRLVARQKGCTGWNVVKGCDMQHFDEDFDLVTHIQISDQGVIPNVTPEPIDPSYLPVLTGTAIAFDAAACNGFHLSASVNIFANLSDRSFTGDVSMAIANMDGSIITVLDGEYANIRNLESYTYSYSVSIPDVVVPSSVQPGYYLIYAVGRQSRCDGWSKLVGLDINTWAEYELYAHVQVTADGVIINSYDPVGDPTISANVAVDYGGGNVSLVNGVVKSGSTLNWTLYNLSSQDISVVAVYMLDGTIDAPASNLLGQPFTVSAGKDVTHTITVGSGGNHAPLVRYEYLCNGYRYYAESSMDDEPHVATITATAGAGGSVSASASRVMKGQSVTFTMSPNNKYHLNDVVCNQVSVIDQVNDNIYTISDVQTNITLRATFAKNKHLLIYTLDGELYHQDSLTVDATINLLPDPEREGYVFSGWSGYPSNRKMPDADLEIVGSFTIGSYMLSYYLDGELYHSASLAYGATIQPLEAPEREGYTFSGWEGLPADLLMPAHDVMVTGSFSANIYQLTYYLDGDIYATQQLAYGAEIVLLDDPVCEGYDFSGWEGYPEDLLMPAHDVVITGNFTLGISSISMDPSAQFVFDLFGRLVGTTGLDDLPSGTYVVAGKKVMKQ